MRVTGHGWEIKYLEINKHKRLRIKENTKNSIMEKKVRILRNQKLRRDKKNKMEYMKQKLTLIQSF